jgi:AcrR family transcriptional regulator
MKQINSKRWDENREKILSVSAHLFWKKGYHVTNIQEIADAASINKATIYYYFENKAFILFEILSKVVGELISHGESIMNSGLPSDKKLERIITYHVIQGINQPDYTGTSLLERRNLPPDL